MDYYGTEDAAYESAREAFEAKRERMIDRAVDLHEAGHEDEAHKLLVKANQMRFTGLSDE